VLSGLNVLDAASYGNTAYPHPCVRGARRKRRIGYLLQFPLDLRDLGALGEGLAIAGDTLLVRVDHHRIRKDEPDYILGVGQTGADSLPSP
jgi:hypothetical protein